MTEEGGGKTKRNHLAKVRKFFIFFPPPQSISPFDFKVKFTYNTPMSLRTLVLVFFVLLLIGAWLIFDWQLYLDDPGLIRDAIAAHKIWAPLIFLLMHAVVEILLVPGSPFTVAGGLLFGTLLGSVYSLVASILASMILFWIIRYSGEQTFILYLHNRFERFRKYSEGFGHDGFRVVLIARLLPFAPNNVVSVALPFTRISGRDLFWGTLLGNIPSTLVLSGAGSLLATEEIGYFALIIAAVSVASGLIFFYKWKFVSHK